jgi:CcmD family protein
MGNDFLVLAYGFFWVIFMLYVWNLSRRQARLRRELEDLKAAVAGRPLSCKSRD